MATMLLTAFFALTALALPHPLPQATTGNSDTEPYATNTTITYYQGTIMTSGPGFTSAEVSALDDGISSCGTKVGSGIIQANYCRQFFTESVAIGGTVNGSCSLTLWSQAADCTGGQKKVIPILNGEDYATCVPTGVLDGGMFLKASGIWACG